MAVPLADHCERIAARVRAAVRLFVFLDFDGTLTPIVNDPMSCRLNPDTRGVITRLNELPGVMVGIVSGRDLADLTPRVGIPGLFHAGNHGFEIEGPGVAFREPVAESRRTELNRLVEQLRSELAGVPGVWVQDKGLTATVHHRNADAATVPAVIETVRTITAADCVAGRVKLRSGKAVVEVRPAVDWHKGKAILWILERFAPRTEADLAIFCGDDQTDEDAFAALPEELTIRVGKDQPTAAAFTVPGPSEVAAFLDWLLTLRTAPQG